jgi:hypothetical protein
LDGHHPRRYGPTGDFIEARTQGIGRDKSDKGAAKALTQARKNLLLSLLSIADKADDADGQTYEDDRAQAEPAASEEHRATVREAIKALGETEQETVKVWLRNHKVPGLGRAGASLTQLNELEDFIAGLPRDPFLVDSPKATGLQGDGDGPDAGTAQGTAPSPPPSPPFEPKVADPYKETPGSIRAGLRSTTRTP